MLVGKLPEKKKNAQLIYLYNFKEVPGPAYLKHVAEFLLIFLEAEPAFGAAGAGTQSVRVVEESITGLCTWL